MKNHIQYIGIDIGGTKCSVVLGTEDGDILRKVLFETKTKFSKEAVISRIKKEVISLISVADSNHMKIGGIGICCGGPLNTKKGIILSPPNLPGWDDVPIVDELKRTFGIDTYIENDANACALAEWKLGAGKGLRNIVFLTFGTGLGAGLILDGRLFRGANDMAGEVGHIRLAEYGPSGYGKSGSFEGFCSGGGIAQIATLEAKRLLQIGEPPAFCPTESALNNISAKKVAEFAKTGDEGAKEVYRIAGKYLGKGLSIIIDLINPEIIVIGSIYTRDRELLETYALEIIKTESLDASRRACKITTSELGENLGDIASLMVAMGKNL